MSYEFWRKALAGELVQIHENDPQEGFYRVRRNKGAPWEPVAIWINGEKLNKILAKRGEDFVDAHEIWTWCCRNPISHDLYKAVRNGAPWPEDASAEIEAAKAEIGHNSGQAHEEALDEILAIDKAFDAWFREIGATITSEEQDAKAETFRTRLHAAGKKAEELRVAEKEPHLKASRDVDAKWKPIVEQAEQGKRRVGAAVIVYRVEREERRKAEEARQRAAEQAAAAKAAQEALEAAKASGLDEVKAMEQAAQAAAETVKPTPSGRAAYVAKPAQGYRTVKVCVVDDLAEAVAAILAVTPRQPDILEVVTKVARRMLEAGVEVKGARMTTEQRA